MKRLSLILTLILCFLCLTPSITRADNPVPADSDYASWISLWTSTDGVSWNETNSRWLVGGNNTWDKGFITAGTSLVTINGELRFYYSGGELNHNPFPKNEQIGYAVISNNLSLTKYINNPLTAGSDKFLPSVLTNPSWSADSRYRMWYKGVNNDLAWMPDYTYSNDGIHWSANVTTYLPIGTQVSQVIYLQDLQEYALIVGADNNPGTFDIYTSNLPSSNWTFQKHLPLGSADYNACGITRRADGKWLVYYQVGAIARHRQIGVFLSNSSNITGEWTNLGVVMPLNSDAQNYWAGVYKVSDTLYYAFVTKVPREVEPPPPQPSPSIMPPNNYSDGGGGGGVAFVSGGDTSENKTIYGLSGIQNDACVIWDDVEAISYDAQLCLTIPSKSTVKSPTGGRLTGIAVVNTKETSDNVISPIYKLTPLGTTISPLANLVMKYGKLDGANLCIASRSDSASVWVYLKCVVDTSKKTISTKVDKLGEYALIPKPQVDNPPKEKQVVFETPQITMITEFPIATINSIWKWYDGDWVFVK